MNNKKITIVLYSGLCICVFNDILSIRQTRMDPQVVGIVGARQAKRKAPARSDHVFEPLLVHGVDVDVGTP